MITVAVCTWNRASLLRQCLQQMTRLRVPAGCDWELLLVDNNSNDDTPAAIDSFARRLPIVAVREPRPGLSHARNAAVAHARGDYVLWTDDDALVDEDWLCAYKRAIERWPAAAVFGGPVVPRFEGTPPAWLTDAWSEIAIAYAFRDLGPVPFALGSSAARLPFGANYAVRMREQRRFPYDSGLGRGQDPSVLLCGEETQVIKAILGSGGEGWWVPDARIEHFITADRQSTEYVRRYFEGRGRLDMRSPERRGAWLLGRPRWAWKQAVVEELRYRWLRPRAAPQRWVPALVRASEAWGVLKGPP